MHRRIKITMVAVLILFGTGGCVGMIIGQTADAAIEVGKIPFKVGAAVVDVATGDDDDNKDGDKDQRQ